jgi:hypothetical protein
VLVLILSVVCALSALSAPRGAGQKCPCMNMDAPFAVRRAWFLVFSSFSFLFSSVFFSFCVFLFFFPVFIAIFIPCTSLSMFTYPFTLD